MKECLDFTIKKYIKDDKHLLPMKNLISNFIFNKIPEDLIHTNLERETLNDCVTKPQFINKTTSPYYLDDIFNL